MLCWFFPRSNSEAAWRIRGWKVPDHSTMLEVWYLCCHLHNQVHLWVGQTIMLMTASNHPVFFGYLPTSGGPPGHNLNDPMYPWNTGTDLVTPASVLDHIALGYKYDIE